MWSWLRRRSFSVVLVAAVISGGALLAAGAAASVPPSDCVQRTSGSLGNKLCLVGPRVVSVNTSDKYTLSVQNTGTKTITKLQLQLRPGPSVTVKRTSKRYKKLSGWDTWTYRNVPHGAIHRVTLTLAFGPRQPGQSHWVETDRTRISGKTFLYQSVSFAQKRK